MPLARGSAPDRRYPKREHLRRNQDFQDIFKAGSSHHGRLLVLFLLERPEAMRMVGIVAGRKVGNAVKRNRAKRLLREAYRHLRFRLPEGGVQFVLVARRGCAAVDFHAVLQELEELLEAAGHLAPNPPDPAPDPSP